MNGKVILERNMSVSMKWYYERVFGLRTTVSDTLINSNILHVMNCVSLYCCVKLQTDIQIERSITYRFISSCHLLYFLYLATYTNTRIQNTS